MMSCSRVLLLGIFLVAAARANATEDIAACRDCNIVLISMDTVRADRIGAINPKSRLTPNIDRIAEKSIVYLDAFAQAPWTLPSHWSVFYGLHPWKLPVVGSNPSVQSMKSLPMLLKEAGYVTAAFTTGMFITPEFGFARGFNEFKQGKDWKDADFLADETTKWLKTHRREKFFLFIHSYHAHDPFKPKLSTLAKIDPGHAGKLNAVSIHELAALALGKKKYSKEELRRISTLYDAQIVELDHAIGRIVDQTKKLGIEKKTVFILFSDHGEELNERGHLGFHGYTLYDEQIHVPLVLKTPASASARLKSPVELTDLFATILNFARVPNPRKSTDSRVLPTTDSPESMERPVFSETRLQYDETLLELFMNKEDIALKRNVTRKDLFRPKSWVSTEMVLRQRTKLIAKNHSPSELYSLDSDAGEKENIYEKFPEKEEKLEKLLRDEF